MTKWLNNKSKEVSCWNCAYFPTTTLTCLRRHKHWLITSVTWFLQFICFTCKWVTSGISPRGGQIQWLGNKWYTLSIFSLWPLDAISFTNIVQLHLKKLLIISGLVGFAFVFGGGPVTKSSLLCWYKMLLTAVRQACCLWFTLLSNARQVVMGVFHLDIREMLPQEALEKKGRSEH